MWRKLLIVCIFGAIGVDCAQAASTAAAAAPTAERTVTAPPGPRRIALVIGNAEYGTHPLANPVRDARQMSATLATLGFEVTSYANASAPQMAQAIADFRRRLAAGGVGVFYFAGHGLQAGGDTMLVPVDADSGSPARLVTKGVALQSVLDAMSKERPNRINLVILDTCLNNPFERVAARAPALPADTLVAYATAPGTLADDGMRQGVYTAALVTAMAAGPRDATAMFRSVASAVGRETGQRQVPWIASSLAGPFSFGAVPRDASTKTSVAEIDAASQAGTLTRGILPKDSSEQYELTFWDSIKDSNYASDYEAYLKAYPNGRFAALARARIDRLRAAAPKTEAPAARTTPAVTAPAEKARPVQQAPTPAPAPAPRQTEAAKSSPAASPAPATAAKGAAGAEIKDCPNCPILIPIAAGTFTMGSNSDDPAEKPPHRVSIGQPFAIGKYEVTLDQWNACADGGACTRIPADGNSPGNTPMRNVSWDDAQVYVKWLSKTAGKAYRLPSEAEWEYAARGGTSTPYWWGDQMRKGNANCKECGDPWKAEGPATVGSFAPNPYGLYDMNGSVWEWVTDCWHSSYKNAPADGRAWEDPSCSVRVIRGGSWRDGGAYMQSATRFKYSASVRQSQNGFRVARDMP